MTPAKCRHCGRPKVNRPRGLCWTCYYTPGVREKIGVLPSYVKNRGHGLATGPCPIPPTPTRAIPGTAEKIAVMEARAAAVFAIFHPDDFIVEPLS